MMIKKTTQYAKGIYMQTNCVCVDVFIHVRYSFFIGGLSHIYRTTELKIEVIDQFFGG